MPTLNAEQYLETSIKSILNQSFTDFELIIVDDGSTDSTIDIIEDYIEEDSRIRIVHRNDGTGITSALNRGISEANGEYIARHDADDWSAEERFQKQVSLLNENEEVALVGTGSWNIDEGGDKISRRRVLESPSFEDLLEHNHYIHGSVMMRKESVESVGGYDEFFPTTEDYDLWLRLAKEFTVRNIDEPLYYFRMHNESIYAEDLKDTKLYHYFAVWQHTADETGHVRRVIKDEGVGIAYKHFSEELKGRYHEEMAQELIRYGELSKGRSHALKAIKYAGGFKPILMLVLSFLGSTAAELVAKYYRKFVVNPGIEEENSS